MHVKLLRIFVSLSYCSVLILQCGLLIGFISNCHIDDVADRGLFMASLVHHEGRILVTGDDLIPMIHVDTEFSSATLSADLYWLMKVTSSAFSLLI